MAYDIYCAFDLEKHKQTYVQYLEVVILEDGTVEYAVPSHQEKLIALACQKKGVSRQELNDLCPREYYYDSRKMGQRRTDEEHYAALEQLAGQMLWLCGTTTVAVVATSTESRLRRCGN